MARGEGWLQAFAVDQGAAGGDWEEEEAHCFLGGRGCHLSFVGVVDVAAAAGDDGDGRARE